MAKKRFREQRSSLIEQSLAFLLDRGAVPDVNRLYIEGFPAVDADQGDHDAESGYYAQCVEALGGGRYGGMLGQAFCRKKVWDTRDPNSLPPGSMGPLGPRQDHRACEYAEKLGLGHF